jgi:MFS transporter, DHA2 family, multidrug resistance protein
MISLQAVIIAYIDDFKLLMVLSLVVMPLVLLLRKPATPAAVDHSAIME